MIKQKFVTSIYFLSTALGNHAPFLNFKDFSEFFEFQLVVNITAKSSKLVARGLPSGHSLFLRVYASNTKGRSRSVTFDGYTLHMADKHPGNPKLLPDSG